MACVKDVILSEGKERVKYWSKVIGNSRKMKKMGRKGFLDELKRHVKKD